MRRVGVSKSLTTSEAPGRGLRPRALDRRQEPAALMGIAHACARGIAPAAPQAPVRVVRPWRGPLSPSRGPSLKRAPAPFPRIPAALRCTRSPS